MRLNPNNIHSQATIIYQTTYDKAWVDYAKAEWADLFLFKKINNIIIGLEKLYSKLFIPAIIQLSLFPM